MSHLFTLFFITSVANIATPGLGAVMAVNISLQSGWKRSIAGCAGLAFGIALLFVAALSGMGAVLAASPKAFSIIQIAGGLFLLYLGIKNFLKKPSANAKLLGLSAEEEVSHLAQFWRCTLISAANPQPMIFGLTVLPQFIDPEISYFAQSALMIIVYAILVFVFMLAYALLADRARSFLSGPRGPRIINCLSGSVFIALAVFVLARALL